LNIASEIEYFRRKNFSSNQKHASLNLLILYLFFFPNKLKALEKFDLLKVPPRNKSFGSQQKKIEEILENFESLWSDSFSELKMYESFLFLAIQYKAYKTVVPILLKLDERFPGNSKIKSRLGKTISNQVIGEYQKGWRYLKQAVELFKNENNIQQLQGHIIYFFYNLLNQHQMELIEIEMKTYENDLVQDADYFRFMAHYSFVKNSNIEEAIGYFEKAIEINEGLLEKREFAESLLRFLSELNSPLYKKYFLKYEQIL